MYGVIGMSASCLHRESTDSLIYNGFYTCNNTGMLAPLFWLWWCFLSAHKISVFFSREKPLGLYVFTEDQTLLQHVLRSTSAGGVLHNDVLQHYSSELHHIACRVLWSRVSALKQPIFSKKGLALGVLYMYVFTCT